MDTEKKIANVEISRVFEVQVSDTEHGFGFDGGDTDRLGVSVKITTRHYAYLPYEYQVNDVQWIYMPQEEHETTMSVAELDYLISQLQTARGLVGKDFLLHSSGKILGEEFETE